MSDLVSLRDAVLNPQLDISGAAKLWGEIDEWSGEAASLRATPPFASAVLERFRGRLAGMQLSWERPRELQWSVVTAELGPAKERPMEWDDWGGPTPYRFEAPTKDFPRAYVLLSVASLEDDRAVVESIVVRRRLVELPR